MNNKMPSTIPAVVNCLAGGLISVFITTAALAQHIEPVAKDNRIYIDSKLSGDSLFTQVGKRLVKSGFALSTTSREFMQITTAVRVISGFNTRYTLTATIVDTRVEIKPVIMTDTDLGIYQWYYRKSKRTVNSYILADVQKTFEGLGQFLYDRKDDLVKPKFVGKR